MKSYRQKIGDIGEEVASEKFRREGWKVENLNTRANFPNCDLEIKKGKIEWRIQVKLCRLYRWISAGGVNPTVCDGGAIFNRKLGYPQADFVCCLSPAREEKEFDVHDCDNWRFFILPVAVAEEAFRINIDAYFNGLKRDGTPRAKKGACQDYVGPGVLTHGVPDHREDFLPYENKFSILG